MKTLTWLSVIFALVVCGPAAAEAPQVAYGVTVVGNAANCGTGVGLRCSNLAAHPYILLGGHDFEGDGGGGYFVLGPSGCSDDGGTILQDGANPKDCFYRADSRTAVPVQWFGAKCDAITTVSGGLAAVGGTQFTSTSVTFQQSDIGKIIELFAVGNNNPNPFRATITAVNATTNTVTLDAAVSNAYPGNGGAQNVSFNPVIQGGLDDPGSGYNPKDTLVVQRGQYQTEPAEVAVTSTGLVGFTTTSGGYGYRVNDIISFAATDGADYNTVIPAMIQVSQVDQQGGVLGWSWLDHGSYKPIGSGNSNPPAFTTGSTSTGGTGFAIAVANNQSFGVASVNVNPVQPGDYTLLPPIPAPTADMTTPSASGATIDLTFLTPSWTYGSDDTVAFQGIEGYMEADTNRGIFNAGEVPGGHTCLLQTLKINRPVTWRSSGSRQAQLMQIAGAQGSTVDGSRYAFVLASANYPASDEYQDVGVGQADVSFENIQIAGGGIGQDVDGDTGPTPYTNDGLLFQNPVGGNHGNSVAAVMHNVQIVNFPGNALSAQHFAGEWRGYNVFAGKSGGNCVDIQHSSNPYRFYELSGGDCTIGLNLVGTKSEEFHGASFWGRNINVSVSGAPNGNDGYILFDGLQLGPALNENMYLDQQNETVLCAANCYFKDADADGNTDAAIVIGPDATTTAQGLTPIVAQFDQGLFAQHNLDKNGADIFFTTASDGHICNCRVALGGGVYDTRHGAPTTNNPTLLTGQTTYAPPTFASGATVGAPQQALTLNPNELGVGVSSDLENGPGKGGLKLRVECSSQSGKVKLVVLAGTSNQETVLADGIGGGVGGSCGS